MASSLSELIAQKDALERQIREAQAAEKADAVARVRKLMSDHGLTAADLAAPPARRGTNVGGKVEPKYRDPVTGSTWSGRGLKPKWLSAALEIGKTLQDFAI